VRERVSSPMAMPVKLDGYALPPEFTLELGDDISDDPDLSIRFQVIDGRVECRAVELRAQEGGREVTLKDLRAVRLLEFMDRAVLLAASPIEKEGVGYISIGERIPGDTGIKTAVNRRRRTINPATLRKVADIARTSEKPVAQIEEALGVATRAAQLWIKRARDITDPETGRPYLTEDD
jgi:hypothetical protein